MENQLINITNKDDQQLVSARDLYKGLKVKKRFSQWVDQNFKSFKEGRDWEGVLKSTPYNPKSMMTRTEHSFTTPFVWNKLCL